MDGKIEKNTQREKVKGKETKWRKRKEQAQANKEEIEKKDGVTRVRGRVVSG